MYSSISEVNVKQPALGKSSEYILKLHFITILSLQQGNKTREFHTKNTETLEDIHLIYRTQTAEVSYYLHMNCGIHFRTRGLWILSPFSYTESPLEKDLSIASMNRKHDDSKKNLFKTVSTSLLFLD